jgi:hypothetical protein
MDQLEKWIGTGPKTFTLLYAITRDGCDPKTFHQKCDNQGATVTVLYNQHGSVYGAYTSASWQSINGGLYVKDDKAFLYQLMFNESCKMNKFPVYKPDNAVIHNGNCGPIFGVGYDLYTFSGYMIYRFGNIFHLNGNMAGFGNVFDNQGVTANQINNDTMEVIELEVYMVTGNI